MVIDSDKELNKKQEQGSQGEKQKPGEPDFDFKSAGLDDQSLTEQIGDVKKQTREAGLEGVVRAESESRASIKGEVKRKSKTEVTVEQRSGRVETDMDEQENIKDKPEEKSNQVQIKEQGRQQEKKPEPQDGEELTSQLTEQPHQRVEPKRVKQEIPENRSQQDVGRQGKQQIAREKEKVKDRVGGMGGEAAKKAGKAVAKKAAKQAGKAAARAGASAATSIGSFIVSTAPIWGPILLAVIGIIFLVVIILISACRVPGANFVPGLSNVCKTMNITEASVGTESGFSLTPGRSGSSSAEDEAVWSVLRDHDIKRNAFEPRTSLAGMQDAAVNEIIAFKEGCDEWISQPENRTYRGRSNTMECEVIVTGGTESEHGHAGGTCSHLSGNKFDLRLNDQVNGYIANSEQFVFAGNRNPEGTFKEPIYEKNSNGVNYVKETNHWDIGPVPADCV